MDNSKTFTCVCGNVYLQKQGLYRHRKTCDKYNSKQVSEDINQELIVTLQSDNAQLLALEQIQKLENDKVQLQNQVYELQEREKNLLIERQKIENDNIQLQKQVHELQERERNMFIEQIKTLQMQLSNKTEVVEPSKQNEAPKQTVPNKKPSVKSYLATCNPVTFTDFMDKYIPTIEDYSNVIKQGIEHGITKNIMAYLLNYKKEEYPIIITNQQVKRMKILVYDTKDETKQWNKIESYKARDYLENMANRFSNKLYKYLSVFKSHYPGIEDKYHKDNKAHCAIRQSLLHQLTYAENYSRKIVERIIENFIIRNDEDNENDVEND